VWAGVIPRPLADDMARTQRAAGEMILAGTSNVPATADDAQRALWFAEILDSREAAQLVASVFPDGGVHLTDELRALNGEHGERVAAWWCETGSTLLKPEEV
jgi:hypothetical protein